MHLQKWLYLTNIMQYRIATCIIVFTMNRGVHYWGKFFILLPFFTAYRDEISEENRSCTIVSTWRKQMLITYVSFSLLHRNKAFLNSSGVGKWDDIQVCIIDPFLHKEQSFLKIYDFFFQLRKYFTPCESMENFGLHHYVGFSQIRSQMSYTILNIAVVV